MPLTLLRHTRVDVPQGICYGQTNVGLANSFKQELEAINRQLNGAQFHCIYSSPLGRCVKLAHKVNVERFITSILYDDRLMELDFGDWEGLKWDEIEQSDAGKYWFADWVNHTTPNGESYAQLVARVSNFIKDLKEIYQNKNILIVAHGGVIRAIYALLKNIELNKAFELEVNYGQIIKIDL